jgi:lipoprotein-releasing system ATP-binding protein
MNNAISDFSSNKNTVKSAPTNLRLAKTTALQIVDLHKSYYKAKHQIPVLKGVDLEINEGDFTAIVGQSGSGKSTLLHLLATLDAPDSGEIWFGDSRIDNLPSRRLEKIRNQQFGLVFQFYHLLPELTTIENVIVPRMIQHGMWSYWRNRAKYRKRALELLETVGLSDRLYHYPRQLSGGEMQRTAIARALVSNPTVLLADEPTGNLDRENGAEVMKTLYELQRTENLTIVMVTHDESIAADADHLVKLEDGRVCLS